MTYDSKKRSVDKILPVGCKVTTLPYEAPDSYYKDRFVNASYVFTKTLENAAAISSSARDLPIFTRDKKGAKNVGARDFLVCDYESFWKAFSNLLPAERVYYEMILTHIPCHVHMDLEYSMTTNPGISEDTVMEALFDLMWDFLEARGFDTNKVSTVVTDSSSVSKFSKHVVIKLEGRGMKNNYHVGSFVRDFQLFTFEVGCTRDSSPLWVWNPRETEFKDPAQKDFVADMAVYTQRRQFRTCFSTKIGQNRFLVPAKWKDRSVYVMPLSRSSEDARGVFFESLVQCTAPVDFIIEWLERDGSEPTSTNRKDAHLGQFALNGGQKRLCYMPAAGQSTFKTASTTQSDTVRSFPNNEILTGAQLPQVALEIVKTIEIDYKTKSYNVKLFTAPMILIVPVMDKRCDIAKREHGSNHVKYMAYLKKGMIVKSCMSSRCLSADIGNGKGVAWKKDFPGVLKVMCMEYVANYVKEKGDKEVDMTVFWGP